MGLIRVVACAAVLFLAGTSASAQSRPERPSRALFGSGVGDVSQLLTGTVSLGGGFDSSLAADAAGRRRAGLTDFDSSGDGITTAGRAGVRYSADTQNVTISAAAETAPRYYPSVYDRIFRRDHAVVATNVRLPFSITASASAAYVPYSVIGMTSQVPGADATELPDNDFPVSLHHYTTWKAGLGTSHRLSRRASLTADTSYSTRRIGAEGRDFRTAAGGGQFRYQIGEGAFLKAGYRYADAQYPGRESYARHLLDVGADLRRDLSIARRTTFSFSTGTSLITYPAVDSETAGRRGGRSRVRLGGSADLRHEMGRTWSATVAYQRGVQFLEGWPEPLLSDSASAKVEGSISRRLQFSASARASTGRTALERENDGFNLYHGGATLSYALNRHVSVGALYSTYHHRFDQLITLPPGFGPWYDRHRIVAQVTAWTPLFSRARRVNVTR